MAHKSYLMHAIGADAQLVEVSDSQLTDGRFQTWDVTQFSARGKGRGTGGCGGVGMYTVSVVKEWWEASTPKERQDGSRHT